MKKEDEMKCMDFMSLYWDEIEQLEKLKYRLKFMKEMKDYDLAVIAKQLEFLEIDLMGLRDLADTCIKGLTEWIKSGAMEHRAREWEELEKMINESCSSNETEGEEATEDYCDCFF